MKQGLDGQEYVPCVPEGEFFSAADMAVDDNGNIFVVDEIVSKLYKVEADCGAVTVIADSVSIPNLLRPNGIDVKTNNDGSVELYISNLLSSDYMHGHILQVSVSQTGGSSVINNVKKIGLSIGSPTDVDYNEKTGELSAIFGTKFPAKLVGNDWIKGSSSSLNSIVDARSILGNVQACCGNYTYISADDNNQVCNRSTD